MSFNVEWHPTLANVLIVTHNNISTMDELLECIRQEYALIDQSETSVHTIYDVRNSDGIPRHFITNLPTIAHMTANSKSKVGLKVLIGVNGLRRTFLDIVTQLYHALHMVDTLEEAEAILRERGAETAD